MFSPVAHINWVTNGSVISISILGTADSDSDKEPVFSVTMLTLPGAIKRTAAMKEPLISQF